MENKRYINKSMIIENLENLEYINTLFNSKSITKDFWTHSFLKNYNKKYNQYNLLRDKVIKETNNSSNRNIVNQNNNLKGLKYLSNVYINLKTDSKWVDIILAQEMLGFDIDNKILSDFEKTTEFVLEKTENYLNKL